MVDHLGTLDVLLGGRAAGRVDPGADKDALDGVDCLRVELSSGRDVARVGQLRVRVFLHASLLAVRLHRPRRLRQRKQTPVISLK